MPKPFELAGSAYGLQNGRSPRVEFLSAARPAWLPRGGVDALTIARTQAANAAASLARSMGGLMLVGQDGLMTFNSDGSGGLAFQGGLNAGMVLDASRGLGISRNPLSAQQAGFDSSAWTTGAGWSLGGGVATFSGGSAALSLTAGFSYTTDQTYLAVFTKTGTLSGSLRFGLAVASFSAGEVGVLTRVFQPPSNSNSVFFFADSGNGGLSNLQIVSLLSPLANAFTQSSNPAKPSVGDALPVTGCRGLGFNGTSQFLQTAALAGTATECFIGLLTPNNPAVATRDVFNRGTAASAGSFFLRQDTSNNTLSTIIHDGTAYRTAASSGGAFVPNNTYVVSAAKGATRAYLRINGSEVASTAFAAGAQAAPVALTVGSGAASLYAGNAIGIWVPADPTLEQHAIFERGLLACIPGSNFQ